MFNCNHLLHPFQNDPGSSQRQRVIDSLLSGAPEIDGRKLADLLDYFVQLSAHVNYYDEKLLISDWQPFFRRSMPFVLASIVKYKRVEITDKFEYYNSLFEKHTSAGSLQLLLFFTWHYGINQVNKWWLQVKDSGLPLATVMEKLIKDKLSAPFRLFINVSNTASYFFSVKKFDFLPLQSDPVWKLQPADLNAYDAELMASGTTNRERLTVLRNRMLAILPAFLNGVKLLASSAEANMELSLFPLQEELQKKHSPHLGLLFAFLKLFNHLQQDLNSYTRKHLDFFYKDVLQLKPRSTTPDKAHILFEIQNQLNSYLLKKGLLLKDGKDDNKAEIQFALDDELVVNKTEIADVRTLFLHSNTLRNTSFIEGTHMAPDARKADGVSIDFSSDPKSWPTLGDYLSKYSDPELGYIKPYPNARIGLLLASPVLLLKEGERSIYLTLDCLYADACNKSDEVIAPSSDPCCEKIDMAGQPTALASANPCAGNLNQPLNGLKLHPYLQAFLRSEYYYVNRDLIRLAIKQGQSKTVIESLFSFLKNSSRLCYCFEDHYRYEAAVEKGVFETAFSEDEKIGLRNLFSPARPLRWSLSGEKGWLEPQVDSNDIVVGPVDGTGRFAISVKLKLGKDLPGVTFYDKSLLQEDILIELPVLKMEINDFIKKEFTRDQLISLLPENENKDCCLFLDDRTESYFLSPYQFLRDIIFYDDPHSKTKIEVSVCGLKNFVVQNDETVMDTRGPVYPFGTRPDIVDFDVNHTVANTISVPGYPNPVPNPAPNLEGPNFFIGSTEIFMKNWSKVCVNINWKDKPVNFNDFYTAYIKREIPDPNNPGTTITILGLNEADFQVNLSLLLDGNWQSEKGPSVKVQKNSITGDFNRKLFSKEDCGNDCWRKDVFDYRFLLERGDFPGNAEFGDIKTVLQKLEPTSLNGFVRINLQNQDFLHKDYAYVLARQMMAMGKFPDKGVEGAIYLGSGNAVIVFKDTGSLILLLSNLITDTAQKAGLTLADAQDIVTALGIVRDPMSPGGVSITNTEFLAQLQTPIADVNTHADQTNTAANALSSNLVLLQTLLSIFKPDGTLVDDLSVPIPNEPWTPAISNIELDYKASASAGDIELIHLHPFKDTYKYESIQQSPSLFPVFCDEGSLFIGLKKLVPGSNLNILFQLAEASSDSESEREPVQWYYLDNNQWKQLRKGFAVLDDATRDLTKSGIVKFALPANMTTEHTIMPKGLHWIKASVHANSKSASETIGIHTQAVLATFTNAPENDKLRLSKALAAQSLSKLAVADASVKKVVQPYPSSGGAVPELEQQYYVRVSELLRHKGRAIQKADYELIVLEAFPQLFKVKCINHSFALNAHVYKNDFPFAPGYVILAVIPDLTKLLAAQNFEPRVPVSILEDVETYLRKKISPFVRLRAMNPRYEKINLCITVKLQPGKDENYYREKLRQEMREFMAPWSVGEYDKLSFGQCVNRSDIIRFLESRDYIDYLLHLAMWHEADDPPLTQIDEVCPKTPRSILVAGKVDVCIKQRDCEKWGEAEPCNDSPIDLVKYC